MTTPWDARANCALILFATLAVQRPLPAQEMVTLDTRPNVTQSYFLAAVPPDAAAVALLFSGAAINLRREEESVKFGVNNFLVRVRGEFVSRKIITAIIDAPADQKNPTDFAHEFRLRPDHFTDVAAVVRDLKQRFPGLPIFLIGTSMGTVSAAAVGARLEHQVAGIVLTSTLLVRSSPKASRPGPGLSRFDFGTIKAPLLFVHHVSDQCPTTPYAEAARLAKNYPLITVFGGATPQSGPCEPFSQHGYFGKESETVEQIVNWMLKKPFLYQVK
jgi:hypothetical protein